MTIPNKGANVRKLVRWHRRRKEAYALRDQGLSDKVIAGTLGVDVLEVRGYWMYPRNAS